jgi:hypothetical protein
MNPILHLIGLYFRTLRHLTFKQVYYQIAYRLKKIVFKSKSMSDHLAKVEQSLQLLPSIPSPRSYLGNGTFVFLHQKKVFREKIEWDFIDFDKLWAYNLNYFDFLHQPQISIQEATLLIDDFCREAASRKEGTEPYPISLRGINWIKFFTYHQINDSRYNTVLYSHYYSLAKSIEYHLLGNHLLENGFSLLFGAYYFRNEEFYKKSVAILRHELEEQILKDGAHFELSPMYHQILLFRLLDCINLTRHNPWHADENFHKFLALKAQKMLGWIQAITFTSGDVPMVNDAAFGISPSSNDLLNYSKTLGLYSQTQSLSESGYRLIRLGSIELFVDIGNIGPDYIPGHAHSDTFNFIIYIGGLPVIVDTGISTYSRNQKRLTERSTESHNTVKINECNQSEIWASFRVGRRAKVIHTNEGTTEISAIHNGYQFLGILHQRTWQWKENTVEIRDSISGKSDKYSCVAYFHFHPDRKVHLQDNSILTDYLHLKFSQGSNCSLEEYDFADGFNLTRKAIKAKVSFSKELNTTLVLSDKMPIQSK